MLSYGSFCVLLIAAFISNGCCDSITEATAVALETSGELLASASLVQKISDDLKAIRIAYPQVNDVVHNPQWTVGEVIAELSDVQFGRITPEYGQVTSTILFGEHKLLTFTQQYNPVVLAKELVSKNLVTSAEPDFVVGGGDSVRYDEKTGIYEFIHGWGDCPSGCINHHSWKFSVSPTGVTLISESGGPIGTDAI